jgi:hypothetical protein
MAVNIEDVKRLKNLTGVGLDRRESSTRRGQG